MSSSTGYHNYYGRSPITARNRMFGHQPLTVVHDDQRMSRYLPPQGGRVVGARDKDQKLDGKASSSRRNQILMHPDDVKAGKKSTWTGMEIKGFVRNLSPALWNYSDLTVLYLNDNALTRIPSEIKLMTKLTILDLSSNKIRNLPQELGELVQLRELLLNNNLIHTLPFELGKLFQLTVLGLKGNPLSPDILALYSELNGTQKLLSFLLDNMELTEPSMPARHWIATTARDDHRGRSPLIDVSVMCYNVLCAKMATQMMYPYCPSWALSWEYRRRGILDEIRLHNADIVTLQEVATDQNRDHFTPELGAAGWQGDFLAKSRARNMNEADRNQVDGCAIFFKTSKFTHIHTYTFEFNQLALTYAEGSDDMFNRVSPKDNVAMAVLLQCRKDPEQYILVATAHFHWNPEYCDVKLLQACMLMKELDEAMDRSRALVNTKHIPLLLTGDLNSLPDSGVLEYLRTGRISHNHPDFKGITSYRATLRRLTSGTGGPDVCSHAFALGLAYQDTDVPHTNYTADFRGMIDYIFHTKDDFHTNAILGPVDQEWLTSYKISGFPHRDANSDHIPLVAQLQLMGAPSE